MWPANLRAAADSFWAWHLAVLIAEAADRWDPRDVDRVTAGETLTWLPEPVAQAAFEMCERHGVPRALLAEQVAAAPDVWGPVRFRDQSQLDATVERFAGSHARILATLADAHHTWQVPYVLEFTRGLFLVGRLMGLPQDVRADRLFIPTTDLEQAGVSVEQLREGRINAPLQRLLWKQVVRARDALAHGAPLEREVSPRYARALRRWWMGGVEMLNVIERRRFDVWSRPVRVTMRARLQVLFQAQFGRTTFRSG